MAESSKVTVKFDAVPRAGNAPLMVKFTDETEGVQLTHRRWDFGDGETSAEQNPTHMYTKPGKYQVQLEGRAIGGGAVGIGKSKPMEIEAYQPGEASSRESLPKEGRLAEYYDRVPLEGPEPGEKKYKVVATCRESGCHHSYTVESMLTRDDAEQLRGEKERIRNTLICPKCSKFGTLVFTVKEMQPEGEDLCDIAIRAALSVLHEKCEAMGCARKTVMVGATPVVVEYPRAEVEVILHNDSLTDTEKIKILTGMEWLKTFAVAYHCEALKMIPVQIDQETTKAVANAVAYKIAAQLIRPGP
jgi:hypothetical protein